LREESALVPRPGEWRDFRDGVDRLREAVDRLERKARASGT
jgi:ubiquinone biosynthesis protein UbiJ